MSDATPEHFDVLIIGAGLSGIGSAWHLQKRCPDRTWALLEARDAIGGTWDLFRYPGIRSDSDMYTLGYRFRPWRQPKAIADGPSIKAYVEEVARDHGIDSEIRFQHRVVRAEWSSDDARWTVDVEVGPERRPARLTCSFIHACTGYYRYDRGYTPEWLGTERFEGRMVHPQHWPEDLDYGGERVVVIGSGATAVTLVPAMLEGSGAAAHVTMLQRSPTYIVGLPSRDRIADALRRWLPERLAYALIRWKNVLRQMFYYQLARRRPEAMKRVIRKGQRLALGDEYDIDTHFSPRYDPWDERLCVVPDNDLFRAIREGRASIVTDQIETFTETGIRLRSGGELDADVIVTATGLEAEILHGVTLVVDGREVELPRTLSYKGMMYSDVPNFASSLGYTNASWTLRADLVSEHVCRLLNHMKRRDYVQCTPRRQDSSISEEPVLNLKSGYIRRALSRMPKQGSQAPWRFNQNYVKDLFALRLGRVDDSALEFRSAADGPKGAKVQAEEAEGTKTGAVEAARRGTPAG
ncbi:MAG: NAD(P)/FAD-dependent oxidoreductase [Gemmatimonadota bacterium]